MGVSEQTFYRWKKRFLGMGAAEIVNYRLEMPNNIAMGHTAKVWGIPGQRPGGKNGRVGIRRRW